MKLLHYVFEIPMIIIAIWGIYNAQVSDKGIIFSLWPSDSEIKIHPQLLLFCILLYGYIWGKINSWFAYSPLRRDLRQQKKANKALNKEHALLNKEHEKLNETVSGLKHNIEGLQEQAKAQGIAPLPENKSKFAAWFDKIKAKLAPKKGN